ncbi:MAG: hypothetical protein QXY36_00750 [Sulfolobales archaeon]
MIKSEVEKVFMVKSGSKKYLVEVNRTNLGKSYIVVHEDLTVKYLKGDEVKEWSHSTEKAEEIDFKALPNHLRRAISLNLRKL